MQASIALTIHLRRRGASKILPCSRTPSPARSSNRWAHLEPITTMAIMQAHDNGCNQCCRGCSMQALSAAEKHVLALAIRYSQHSLGRFHVCAMNSNGRNRGPAFQQVQLRCDPLHRQPNRHAWRVSNVMNVCRVYLHSKQF